MVYLYRVIVPLSILLLLSQSVLISSGGWVLKSLLQVDATCGILFACLGVILSHLFYSQLLFSIANSQLQTLSQFDAPGTSNCFASFVQLTSPFSALFQCLLFQCFKFLASQVTLSNFGECLRFLRFFCWILVFLFWGFE